MGVRGVCAAGCGTGGWGRARGVKVGVFVGGVDSESGCG